MAEAHAAANAFSLAITHEGVDVNFDWQVLSVIWSSGIRAWKKRFERLTHGIHAGIYPAPLYSLGITCGLVSALSYKNIDLTFGFTEFISRYWPGPEIIPYITTSGIAATLIWLSAIMGCRFALKMLFHYKGWMFEARGKGVSFQTRLWGLLVKVLSIRTPSLYSFQGSMPRLPLPDLDGTMSRYLKSVRPLKNDEQFDRMVQLAEEFKKGIGRKLQRYLKLKSWVSTNYVSDWWEEYVYLRGRGPLMINSNFYGIDAILIQPTTVQAARAANTVHEAIQFRREIDHRTLQPIMVQKMVPLCSSQYERTFNTTRIPGVESDYLLHLADSRHIAVYHKGQYYKMPLYDHNRLLNPCEMEVQIQRILDDKALPDEGEEKLAALTAGARATWCNARKKYFSKGINKVSLDVIETAAFVLVLDTEPLEFDPEDPRKLDTFGRRLLHGRGYDRWFDKSFNLIVGSNGKVGFNAEHSWADAPIMAHAWELMVDADGNRYDADGHTLGEPEFDPPTPIRLHWDLNKEALDVIDRAVDAAQILLEDVDLHLYMHDPYGKGLMKKCRVSPDAYIQMALQLAYYRNMGRFDLTYEASMTRLYKEGRTETVRPCTVQSSAFVLAMEDPTVTDTERIRLMRVACDLHQNGYRDAMCGKGIDRHLFCLYVVSKYLEVDSPFLTEVLSEPWRLSTSQTPHGQTDKLDLVKHPKCISAGGGFGPVADDGYGVSYIVAGEDLIFFHISSKKSSPETDSHKFAENIRKALDDIRQLFATSGKPSGK